MGDASNVQTDFRGGEWSSTAQGRLDDREYTRSLNVCLNGYPTEQGSWTRRQGARFIAYTYNGLKAWLLKFAFSQNAPYTMELTGGDIGSAAGNLRFYANTTLVMTGTPVGASAISGADPAVLTTVAAHGWTSNDQIQFLANNGTDVTGLSVLFNRQFTVTVLSSTTASLIDAVSGVPLDGTLVTGSVTNLSAGKILNLATPYDSSQIANVVPVQCELLNNNQLYGNVVMLNSAVAPQVVANNSLETGAAFAGFSLAPATFVDGPYFDPVSGAVSSSGVSGTITLSGAPANTFASTDVGRAVRLLSEPPAWAVGTAYSIGNPVKYTDGNYYTATAASTGKAPNLNPTLWALDQTIAQWAWGTIASYISGTSVTVTLSATPIAPATTNVLLYSGSIATWRLGVYSATTGYPTCGIFHEGRLWLGGAQPNRFDASMSNQPFVFSPTLSDGTVTDDNGISYLFNSDDVNQILWMGQEHQGIICGTLGGEWLIQASAMNDPLTPTSVQAHRVTKYKTSAAPPVRTEFATFFVQAHALRVLEYVADAYSGRYLGRNMTEKASHLTGAGVSQLAYQQDVTPTVWARMNDGTFAGMTYKRESGFTNEPPVFAGWHRHALGIPNSTVESIAVGPNVDGTLESMWMSVLDPRTGFRHVEMMTDGFQETNTIEQAWFVDGGVPATTIKTTATTAVLGGFTPWIGQTISVWGAGIDLGDYVVAADGSITLTFGTPALFTAARLATYTSGTPLSAWDTRVTLNQAVTYASPAAQSMQVFDNTTGSENRAMLNDRDNGRVAVLDSFGGGSIATFDRTSGALTSLVTAATLFANAPLPASNHVQSGGGAAIDTRGNIYFGSDGSNSGVIRQVNLTKQKITASYGTQSGTLNPANGIFSNLTMACAPVWIPPKKNSPRDNRWVDLLCVTALLGQWWKLFDVDTGFAVLASGTVDEARAQVCAGKSFANNANATSYTNFHMIGRGSSGNLAPLGVYKLSVLGADKHLSGSPAQSKAGTIAVAAIDGTWTNVSNVYGPVYDKTDDTIIIGVNTTDVVTNQNYVIKINPNTAAIIWKTATAGAGIGTANIQYGTLAFCNGNNKVISIATATGVATTTTLTGVVATNNSTVSDDYDGALWIFCSYTTGGGAPTPVNGTPSFTNLWGRFQGAAVITQQSVGAATFDLPSVPFVGGYTYTSQGQILRPVGSGQTGAQDGPGFAKTKRTHKVGVYLSHSQKVSIGAAFNALRPISLTTNGTLSGVVADNVLFTGVTRTEIDCPYDYDNMICWQITRPYPATVGAIGGFLETQDINGNGGGNR